MPEENACLKRGYLCPPLQVQVGLSWNYNAISLGAVDVELTPEVVAAQNVVENFGSNKGRNLLQNQEEARSSSALVSK
eukprot:1156994-Pelagomonas_calceolata.AAC.12